VNLALYSRSFFITLPEIVHFTMQASTFTQPDNTFTEWSYFLLFFRGTFTFMKEK
jgi:hypothetical protein